MTVENKIGGTVVCMKNIFFKIITLSLCMIMLMNVTAYNTCAAAENDAAAYSAITACGVWHRPNASGRETTLEGLCSVLDEMATAGINMVFLETFYHGMTVYKTNLVPYYTGFDKFDYGEYPDYLTAFATEAQKRGIEVHAWVESFYLGISEDATLVKYFPEWLLKNEQGSIRHKTEGASLGGYIFLDPANADACAYLVKLYDEMLKKVPALCGLNLDYIRYPVSDFYAGTDTGYTTAAMAEFAELYDLSLNENTTPATFKQQIKSNSLVGKWTDYRAGKVTEFVRQVAETVNENHRDRIISIAVHPDIANAYNQKKQDFITWVESGYIDVVTPMVYYYTASQISSALKEMLPKFENVYCYAGLYTTYHDQSTGELEAHIRASEKAGADGYVLFESVKTFFNPAHSYAEFLSQNLATDPVHTALPHWSSERLIAATSDILAQKLTQNGESEAAVNALVQELARIQQIGESTPEKLEETIAAITALGNGMFPELSLASKADVTASLTSLVSYLEVRQERLSAKGYPEEPIPPTENEGEDAPTDKDPTEECPDSPTPENNDKPKTLIDMICSFFKRIIDWFKSLFAKK